MGGSLHEAGVDMSVYYIADAGDAYHVVATFAPAAVPADAARLQMRLADGDAVRFALPHHPGTMYSFERNGEVVAVSARPADAPQS
jgi:hypothetical protein